MEGNRSVVKNRNGAGCLIIKKRADGIGGVGTSGQRKLYESKKERKRRRLICSDSFSSDEDLLEFHRGRVHSEQNEIASGSVESKKGIVKDGEFIKKKSKVEYVKGIEEAKFGRNGMWERQNSTRELDVYDFDEYDDVSDVETCGRGSFLDRESKGGESSFSSMNPVMKSSGEREFEPGCSKGDVIYRRRNSFRRSMSDEKIRFGDHSVKKRYDMKLEHSASRLNQKFGSPSDEAIRLQGKNGVLKLKVNHKNKVSAPLRTIKADEVKQVGPQFREVTSRNAAVHSSFRSETKVEQKPVMFNKTQKGHPVLQKSLSSMSKDRSDEESEDSDTSSKSRSDNVLAQKFKERGRTEGGPSSERTQLSKLKQGKVKRGCGTEKQRLREKIRNMLVNAGWTIDYRPRRGRDYSDAVYVNPSGTAYWSIIKAYDALQKQLEEEGEDFKGSGNCFPFTPLSDELLGKLTRQTRKKIEKELKRKKKKVTGRKRRKVAGGKFTSAGYGTDSTDSSSHGEKMRPLIKQNGKSFKGRWNEAISAGGSHRTYKLEERGAFASNHSSIHGRKSKKIGRCTLLIRNPESGLDSENDGFIPYRGRRTLLSWLIDSRVVKLSEKVLYMNRRRTKSMLEGWITRDGIHCGCCSKILTVYKFEIHAGSKLRQPYQNICLSSGVSLLQCQVDAWNRQDETHCHGFHAVDTDGDDPNDDTCAICGDGGDLICCDGCPSTFHQSCLNIKMLPPGDWHCPHCSCKFCGLADENTTQESDTTKAVLLACSLCERKYHHSCVQDMDAIPGDPTCCATFCGRKCQELFDHLQKLLGVKHELESGLSWSLIHRTDLDPDTSSRGFTRRVEWNSKLAVALTVMDECFLPIIDRRSGINLIHNVVFNCGSNFMRLNYSGFYTAILERGDEIVAVASIRIRGPQLAEMPFIGTRHIYRRQGMFRRLLSAIKSVTSLASELASSLNWRLGHLVDNPVHMFHWDRRKREKQDRSNEAIEHTALHSLKVERLIIPAISELMHTWTTTFGFGALEGSYKQDMKFMNMLVFPGTDMLQKKLLDQEAQKKDLEIAKGRNSSKVDGSLIITQHANAATKRRDNAINDKSGGDSDIQDPTVSAKETSPHAASQHVSGDVNPHLHEVNLETPSSKSQLEDKLTWSDPDMKVHSSSALCADVPEAQNSSADSATELNIETSAEGKEIREAIFTNGDSVMDPCSSSACISAGNSSLDVARGDHHQAPCDGNVCSDSESENPRSDSDAADLCVQDAAPGSQALGVLSSGSLTMNACSNASHEPELPDFTENIEECSSQREEKFAMPAANVNSGSLSNKGHEMLGMEKPALDSSKMRNQRSVELKHCNAVPADESREVAPVQTIHDSSSDIDAIQKSISYVL